MSSQYKEERPIPPSAQVKIKELHQDLVAKARAYETAREAFNEFIRTTRTALKVEGEGWGIREDASSFVKESE